MKKFDATFFPQYVTAQEKEQLGQIAAHAEQLSRDDLEKLIYVVEQIREVEQTAEKEAAEKAAFEQHYRDVERREIESRVRQYETELAIKRQRVAAALGIPADSPELRGIK